MLHQLRTNLSDGWTVEHRFHHVRKWRFDLAHVKHMIAVEIEGGIFSGGRHSRGAGMLADMEKYNTATKLGWRLLRYSTQQVSDGQALRDIAEAMEGWGCV